VGKPTGPTVKEEEEEEEELLMSIFRDVSAFAWCRMP
jgi:hypothetical protein